ncbi:MAG TPA: hypothetical protein PLZ57_08195 [Pseudobdellovibrionaceae bacterium]|nr:hypothetical protein [Pseudobdellovibrionaceae bacterium]
MPKAKSTSRSQKKTSKLKAPQRRSGIIKRTSSSARAGERASLSPTPVQLEAPIRPTPPPPPPAPLPNNLVELALEERSFLHDLANPLAISAGMIEALLEAVSREGQLNPAQLRQLNKAREALHRLGDLLNVRRKRIVEIQDHVREVPHT